MQNSNHPPLLESVVLVRQPQNYSPSPYYAPGQPYGVEGLNETSAASGLLDYWRIFARHKKLILICCFLGALLGFGIGIPMKPIYRARTSLEVLSMNEDFMNMKQSTPVTTNDGSYETSEEETQAKLLESDALMNRVFEKIEPGSTQRVQAPYARTGWRSWLHLREHQELTPTAKMLVRASKSLKIKPTPRTRMLEITAESENAQFAANFLNTLVQEYIQQSIEARLGTTQRTSVWLERELADARSRLRRSEDALQEYARTSRLIFTTDNTNVVTEKLEQIQQEFSNAISNRIAKQARYELAQSSPPDSLADVLSDAGLQTTSAKLNDARRQLADLSAIFNPDYSKVKRAQAEVTALETAFSQNRADIIRRIQNDYQEAVRKEKLLATAYDVQTSEVTGQGEKEIQYNILKRDADSNRQLYDTMLQQMKQASIASALGASNARIVDPALLPELPVFPNPKLDAALGAVLGLLLSAAFSIVRERADRTLQQPGDLKLWTDIAELGTIPAASAVGAKSFYGLSGTARRQGGRASKTAKSLELAGPVELITWGQKPSLAAEAFRSALTSILFIGETGKRPRVLVFSSAQPSEGKTTVVSNLAIASAEIRRRVLIVDADLRRPRMHTIFSLSNERGLADILGEEWDEGNLSSLVQSTGFDGLDVITGGPPTHSAANLLHSPNFEALLMRFRSEYDMILIDTPPMLHMTDARVAGRLADAVVLIARSGKTTRDALVAAKERFDEDRIPVLGGILNDWDPRTSLASHYSSSAYKSYQAYSAKA